MTIEYKKLAVLLLPTFLRQPLVISLTRVAMVPMQRLHDAFQGEKAKRLYELEHTSQTCHIKAALNDEFGITEYYAGFDIEDLNTLGDWVVAYDEVAEFEEAICTIEDGGALVVWDEEIIMAPTEAFAVIMPPSVEWNEYNIARIKAVVNKYRLASRTFSIRF